jgi:ATP-dependent DNA helicase RecG
LKYYGLNEGGERPAPKVGCVVVTKPGKINSGYRGELEPGEDAEFTVMEKKMVEEQLAGATVYTTLEPCTDRKPPKKAVQTD